MTWIDEHNPEPEFPITLKSFAGSILISKRSIEQQPDVPVEQLREMSERACEQINRRCEQIVMGRLYRETSPLGCRIKIEERRARRHRSNGG